jgi:hypothetical protein
MRRRIPSRSSPEATLIQFPHQKARLLRARVLASDDSGRMVGKPEVEICSWYGTPSLESGESVEDDSSWLQV